MTKKSCLLLLCLLCSGALCAQTLDTNKLNRYFDLLETNNKFMGSIAVSKEGKIIYTRSIGFADIAQQLKADQKTKYRIGSISKTFTAVLVMKAVEDGRLNLNQTIGKFFPAVKNSSVITIRQLLSHRSGIHNFTDNDDYTAWNTTPQNQAQMLKIIAAGGSDFDSDTKSAYSNTNYVLLSYILQKVYKKSFSEILSRYITKPLALNNTYVGSKINPANNEARSYTFDGQWKVSTETDLSIPMGAGGIVSNPVDITKFSHALFSGKLLNDKTIALMETIKDGYGLGLLSQQFFDKKGYGHRGGIDAFTSVFTYFPQDKISFSLTSNGSNYNSNEIPMAVLSSVFNKPFELPDFASYEVKDADLDQYTGIYASEKIPLKLTVTKEKNQLLAQASGQSAMPLEAAGKNKFKITKAGIVMEFDPAQKTMLLKQGGGEFKFERQP
ncbi:serine hydrolase domain-containing protein [Pedobacter agri]|uniref:serine hydrolase domain-containing protein n=1 Tax=Pedobacter agri TaxID=454586 RepID=UPI00292E7157|nr:serine hydrolase domain-containing protein [Pedobacter agri]